MSEGSEIHEELGLHQRKCAQCAIAIPAAENARIALGPPRRIVPAAMVAALCATGARIYRHYLEWLAASSSPTPAPPAAPREEGLIDPADVKMLERLTCNADASASVRCIARVMLGILDYERNHASETASPSSSFDLSDEHVERVRRTLIDAPRSPEGGWYEIARVAIKHGMVVK